MSEKEKSIISKIAQAVPKMSEFDKGYLLGKAEALVDDTEKEEKNGGQDGQFAGFQQPGVRAGKASNH